jgi:hypothetical protein
LISFQIITYANLIFRWLVGDFELVRNLLRLLGCYGGEMVGRGLAEDAPREKRPTYADARCTSPSGQRQPQQIQEDICKSPPLV